MRYSHTGHEHLPPLVHHPDDVLLVVNRHGVNICLLFAEKGAMTSVSRSSGRPEDLIDKSSRTNILDLNLDRDCPNALAKCIRIAFFP